jgi:mannose-6-phosphate isomerase-like protein (cupin superfamily)
VGQKIRKAETLEKRGMSPVTHPRDAGGIGRISRQWTTISCRVRVLDTHFRSEVKRDGGGNIVRIVRSDDRRFVPAGHEDLANPGVWKKVLFEKADLQAGHVQMINWASLPSGNSFSAHYHEDMQEVFVIINGTAQLIVGSETATLKRGDAILIDPHEVHVMSNPGKDDVEYLALGISRGIGGQTVVVNPNDSSADDQPT